MRFDSVRRLVLSSSLLLLSLSSSSSVSAALTCPADSSYSVSAYDSNGSYGFTVDIVNSTAAAEVSSAVLRLFAPGSSGGSDEGIFSLIQTSTPPDGASKEFQGVGSQLVAGQEYDGHGALTLTDGTVCSTPTASYTLPLGTSTGGAGTGAGGETISTTGVDSGGESNVGGGSTTSSTTGGGSPSSSSSSSSSSSESSVEPGSQSSTGVSRLSCPNDGVQTNETSYVDDSNIYYYEFNILDPSIIPDISSFVLRLFDPSLPCGPSSGEDDGLWGFTQVTPTPPGFAARYLATGGLVSRCTEYNGHVIMSLKDGTLCTLGYQSVDVYELKGTTGSAGSGAASSTGVAGSGSGSGGSGATGPIVIPPPVTPPGVCPIITFQQSVTRTDTNGVIKLQISFTNGDDFHHMDWVDFHVSVNRNLEVGGKSQDMPQYNYRMDQDSANQFSVNFPSNTAAIQNTDYINYFFTYSADHLACDTDVIFFAVSPPSGAAQVPPPQCPVIQYNQSASADTNSNSLTLNFANPDIGNIVQWVDAHVTIVSSTVNGQFNYRMKSSSVNQFTLTMPTSDGVIVPADASVSYFFTYFVDGIGCNTDNLAFSSSIQGGPRGACPALTYSPIVAREPSGVLNVTFNVTNVPSKVVAWVDLHVLITDALSSGESSNGVSVPNYNYRMVKISDEYFNYVFPGRDGVTVPETSYVQYFFTYSDSTDRTDCNTEWFQYGAASAVAVASNRLGGIPNGNDNTNGNTGKTNGAGQRYSFEGALAMSVMAPLALIIKNWV